MLRKMSRHNEFKCITELANFLVTEYFPYFELRGDNRNVSRKYLNAVRYANDIQSRSVMPIFNYQDFMEYYGVDIDNITTDSVSLSTFIDDKSATHVYIRQDYNINVNDFNLEAIYEEGLIHLIDLENLRCSCSKEDGVSSGYFCGHIIAADSYRNYTQFGMFY